MKKAATIFGIGLLGAALGVLSARKVESSAKEARAGSGAEQASAKAAKKSVASRETTDK